MNDEDDLTPFRSHPRRQPQEDDETSSRADVPEPAEEPVRPPRRPVDNRPAEPEDISPARRPAAEPEEREPQHRRKKFETAPNTGALFRVDTKQTDKHPDYTGHLRIGERLFEIAGWSRKSESGKRYIFVKISGEKF
jgi:hypothetical protein